MNILNLLVSSYARLSYYPGIPFWVMTPFRRVLRFVARHTLPSYMAKPANGTQQQNADIIISFTSFPARINNVWQVVECMMRQTYKPRRILLWLSKEQFSTPESIPASLRQRENDVFQIRMVDGDLRSHKKYYYVSKEYPDSLIFLIDDDIYYDTRLVERTMKASENHPDAVICNYGYHVTHNPDGSTKPYNSWIHETGSSTSSDLFFGSGGGTLFRPCNLHPDLTDIDSALACCPIADDIWLNAMTRLAHRPVVMLKNGIILPIFNANNVELRTQNQDESKNDQQINAVNEHYKTQIF